VADAQTMSVAAAAAAAAVFVEEAVAVVVVEAAVVAAAAVVVVDGEVGGLGWEHASHPPGPKLEVHGPWCLTDEARTEAEGKRH